MSPPRIAIVGGGFAGLACANTLDSRRFDVTLIDARPHFEFLPNIHEIVSGVKSPAGVRLGLAEAMEAVGHRFLHAEVTAFDPATLRLTLGQRRQLCADYVVVALGAADATFGIAGVGEHTLGFKSARQCQAIHRRLEVIAGSGGGRVVVVGGGLEGIEALGELLRRYRHSLRDIAIVEAQERLLPGGDDAVDAHLRPLCEEHGVEVISGDPVAKITPKTVFLKSGRRLRSDATIWTGGPAPPPLLAASGLASAHGWAPVHDTLEHRDFEHVFVAGDAAELPRPVSKQAYHALDMGVCVAQNLARSARKRRLRQFRPSPKPTLMTFGDLDTVLIADGLVLAGPALAAGKEAVYATVLAELDKRALPTRAGAVVERGQRATRRLLWPALSDLAALRRRAKLKRLA